MFNVQCLEIWLMKYHNFISGYLCKWQLLLSAMFANPGKSINRGWHQSLLKTQQRVFERCLCIGFFETTSLKYIHLWSCTHKCGCLGCLIFLEVYFSIKNPSFWHRLLSQGSHLLLKLEFFLQSLGRKIKDIPPWKLPYPVKIDGWKLEDEISFQNGSFSGDMLIFGVIINHPGIELMDMMIWT